jgi:uncharacterized phage-associated protein
MYEARKLTNLLLSRYDAQRFELTNLRLNKLLYFIHAESLADRPEGLVRNHFEAWQFGPVIRPVFNAFKSFGDTWISAPASYLDYASGTRKVVAHDDIAGSDVDFIIHTFEKYGSFSTGALVDLSHAPGGPWDIVYRAWLADQTLSPRIPNDLIRTFYVDGGLPYSCKH